MELNHTIVVPILISAVELIKGLGVPSKYAALISVILGAVIGVVYLEPHDWKTGLLEGVVYGFSASGLYSGAKNTAEQLRSKK